MDLDILREAAKVRLRRRGRSPSQCGVARLFGSSFVQGVERFARSSAGGCGNFGLGATTRRSTG
jgi:hypothetical protein